MGLLVFAFTGLQDVRANEADEARKTGLKYYNGEGVKQDYQEALKWFRKAADKGDTDAQYEIGTMYAAGDGVTADPIEALKWLRKAAAQGNADAQCEIGDMCRNGQIRAFVQVDPKRINESEEAERRLSLSKIKESEQVKDKKLSLGSIGPTKNHT